MCVCVDLLAHSLHIHILYTYLITHISTGKKALVKFLTRASTQDKLKEVSIAVLYASLDAAFNGLPSPLNYRTEMLWRICVTLVDFKLQRKSFYMKVQAQEKLEQERLEAERIEGGMNEQDDDALANPTSPASLVQVDVNLGDVQLSDGSD